MSEVQKLLAEVKAQRLDAADLQLIQSDVDSQLLGRSWGRIANGVILGVCGIQAGYDLIERPTHFWSSLPYLFLLALSFEIGYGIIYRRKTKALLRLIEKEAPALHAKISKRETA